MTEYTILIIEDDEKMRRLLELILGQEGYRVDSVSSGQQGIEKLGDQSASNGYDLVLTDLQMPGLTGMDVLEHVRKALPEMPVLIVTGFGTVKTAVEAMKKGAYDYIAKPIDNEELKCVVKRALEIRQLFARHKQLSQGFRDRFNFDRVVGNSEQIQKVKKLLADVVDTDTTILITGESGTGKELLARAIHYSSRRAQCPLVTINCAAIPETLLESELFGYEKGAFTDAKVSKPGRLKIANGGTVFLDEVAELSPMTQVKLLRVLQEKEIEPLGGTKSIKVDIRIIAATNKDLFEQVKKGHFREDLYYRINVFPVHVPPLRERKEDIRLLLEFFVHQFSHELGKKIHGFSPEALSILEQYAWPGNIRELENLVERVMIICKRQWVEAADLPTGFLSVSSGQPSGPVISSNPVADSSSLLALGLSSLEQLEERLIRDVLERTSGNVTEAARLLKTTRNTLRYRMHKYGLSRSKSSSQWSK
jgi:DNA-binding NtrC family response regulator